MKDGWIKLHRELIDHWLWKKKPFTLGQAWIDLLLEANHEDNKVLIKGEIYECKRGQSLHSVNTWGLRWGWSRQQVRTFLKLLENDSMVIRKSTNKTTILSICNYDKYQDQQPAKKPATNQHLTSTQPALNHKQECKNEKNEKNKEIYKEGGHLSISWDEFNKLADEFGLEKADLYINKVLNYRKNSKYKSLYLTALNWLRNDLKKHEGKPKLAI